jgi:glycine/D-amino acid oxidase-like deaminating enzyme
LGAYLLEQARHHGLRLIRAHLASIETSGGRVQAVRLDDGSRIETRQFVNAAGPMVKQVGAMLGVDLPVFCELHLKAAFKDYLGVVPRHAPLLILSDEQVLPWTQAERELLAQEEETRWLAETMPAGVHTRPEGGVDSPVIMMLWEYRTEKMEPVWPVPLDPAYAEIVLRGLATMLPGLRAYFERFERPILDGGYYTKTRENRPLIGPLPVEGAYILGALSGFGLMAACAAGELLAAHMTRDRLPAYAAAFQLERYQDPAYLKLLATQQDTGQL